MFSPLRHYSLSFTSSLHSAAFPSPLAPSRCLDNLIKGPRAHGPPFLFHHAVTLSWEKYSFIGFLSLSVSFYLCQPLSHFSLFLPLVTPLASISPPLPLHLFLIPPPSPRSHHRLAMVFLFAALFLCYMSPSLFSTLTAGTKAHRNQASSNHKPIGH